MAPGARWSSVTATRSLLMAWVWADAAATTATPRRRSLIEGRIAEGERGNILCMRAFVLACSMCMIAAGQPQFEAASVKRMERGVIENSIGSATVVLKGDPLKIILMEAYGVKAYQIAGPAWMDDDCFEIVAKMPEGATRDQVPAMLQALLAERFGLVAHKENRPHPVYALVVDKGGPKMQAANQNFRRDARPRMLLVRASSGMRGFKGAMTMSGLAHHLSVSLGREVQDATGVDGTFEVDLLWAPDPTIDAPAGPNSFVTATAASGDSRPDLPTSPTANVFMAVRELGLKLEARTAPVETLVIDRVERTPREN